MSPEMIQKFARYLTGLLIPLVAGWGIWTEYPGTLEFLQQGLTFIIVAILIPLTSLVNSSQKSQGMMRLAAAVWAVVRAEAETGTPNSDLRQSAIEIFRDQIGTSNLGWRGWFLRTPFLGNYLIGMLFDSVSSGYARLVGKFAPNALDPTTPPDPIERRKAHNLLDAVKARNGVTN